jgi:hypothetical protein
MASTNPAIQADLVIALNNVGISQVFLGNPERALAAFEEALRMIRPLAAANPAFEGVLKLTLHNLEKLKARDTIQNAPPTMPSLPSTLPGSTQSRSCNAGSCHWPVRAAALGPIGGEPQRRTFRPALVANW